MKRSPRPYPDGAMPAAGMGITRNPGVMAVVVTREPTSPFVADLPDGRSQAYLFRLPRHPQRLQFWRRGRQATFMEVMHSIDTGLPLLAETISSKEEVLAFTHELQRTLDMVHDHYKMPRKSLTELGGALT